MTKTLAELIDRACDIKINFGVASFELNHYEDGSFVDFHVRTIVNVDLLVKLAGELELKMFSGENDILVRVFERDVE